MVWNGEIDEKNAPQYDIDVTSKLLNLHVSFRWRALVCPNMIKEFKKWTEKSRSKILRFILVIGRSLGFYFTSFS